MILQITFKTPDVLADLEKIEDEDSREEAEEFIRRYVSYSEYVTLEFDLDKKTVRVLER